MFDNFPISIIRSNSFPKGSECGAFWENRGDRRHCGVDLYADVGTLVKNIEAGIVYECGKFTSKEQCRYWNDTYYVLIKPLNSNVIIKYSELKSFSVKKNDFVNLGDTIGEVGSVLIADLIDEDSPQYVKKLAEKGNYSMLHLELHKYPYIDLNNCMGGNYFGNKLPDSLLNIEEYLNKTIEK